MLNLSQNDPRWRDKKMDKSKYTLGTNGCLVTVICDIWSKFYYNPSNREYLRPDEAIFELDLVAVTGDSDPRYVLWSSVKNIGMKFLWRNFNYKPDQIMLDPVTRQERTQMYILKKYMKHPDYGICLRVKTSTGGEHWIAGIGKSVFGFAANNPWNGKRLWRAPKPYPEFDGFAILQKYDT